MDDKRKDHSDQKTNLKRNRANHYRPITYLRTMWNIQTAQIRKEIYDSLISRRLLPEERKECRKWTRGTGGLLYIDQHILYKSNTRRKKLALVWKDYKTAYDIVPQSWIKDCLKMYKISGEVIKFIENTMKNWRMELTAGGNSLTGVKNSGSDFPGRCAISITFYRKCTSGYKLHKSTT